MSPGYEQSRSLPPPSDASASDTRCFADCRMSFCVPVTAQEIALLRSFLADEISGILWADKADRSPETRPVASPHQNQTSIPPLPKTE